MKVAGDDVYLELPPTEVLDTLLATDIGCHLATSGDTTLALTGASCTPSCFHAAGTRRRDRRCPGGVGVGFCSAHATCATMTALLMYTFGVMFSAFAITYRYTVWLQRPPTRCTGAAAGATLAAAEPGAPAADPGRCFWQ